MSRLDEAIRGLDALPCHLHGGLRRYIEHGVEPGSFLRAVIENDLLEAVCRADDGLGIDDLRRLSRFFYNDCPSPSWGSREKRLEWQGRGGLLGADRERPRD